MLTLTLSALQTKTDTYANSVDPDEMAHNKTLFAVMNMPKFKDGRIHFRNLGVKC